MSKIDQKFNQKARLGKVPRTVEVGDLTEEEAKMIEEFVNFLKAKRKGGAPRGKEEIAFRSWPLKVKGKLTREEIYDHL